MHHTKKRDKEEGRGDTFPAVMTLGTSCFLFFKKILLPLLSSGSGCKRGCRRLKVSFLGGGYFLWRRKIRNRSICAWVSRKDEEEVQKMWKGCKKKDREKVLNIIKPIRRVLITSTVSFENTALTDTNV